MADLALEREVGAEGIEGRTRGSLTSISDTRYVMFWEYGLYKRSALEHSSQIGQRPLMEYFLTVDVKKSFA